MSKNNIILSLLLLFAIVASWWLVNYLAQTAKLVAPNDDSLDAFMANATYMATDENGLITHKLVTPYAEHYLHRDSSKLQSPYITIYNKDQQPWLISSKTGGSEQGLAKICLQGEVKLYQAPGNNNNETTITTDILTILPQQQIAVTKSPVVITQPNAIINAVGLKADLASGNIELSSKARGVYNAAP